MRAIILDNADRILEALEGTYRDGTFTYKRNQMNLWVVKVGGEKNEIEFDYDKLIPIGKEKVAFYRWDGKNLTQLSFGQFKESSVTVDYMKNFKLGEYAKASVLKPPQGLQDLLHWMVVFLLIVVIIGFALVVNSDLKQIQQQFKPISQVANETMALQIHQGNEIVADQLIQNATLHYMENLTQYLQTHKGG